MQIRSWKRRWSNFESYSFLHYAGRRNSLFLCAAPKCDEEANLPTILTTSISSECRRGGGRVPEKRADHLTKKSGWRASEGRGPVPRHPENAEGEIASTRKPAHTVQQEYRYLDCIWS